MNELRKVLACAVWVGCGGVPIGVSATDASPGSKHDAAVDASQHGDAKVDTDASAPVACNDLPEDAPMVATAQALANMPAPAGGTIQPGTYVLTGLVFYFGGTNIADATGTTLVVTPTTMEWSATNLLLEKVVVRHSTAKWTANGTSINVVETCPMTTELVMGFTASGTTLRLYLPEDRSFPDDPGAGIEQVFERK